MDDMFNRAEQAVNSEINNIRNDFNGGGGHYNGSPLQTDRNIFVYIVFSIITCGIYSYYYIYRLAQDVNIVCQGDGKNTGGLIQFILLSILTCGFYSLYWQYSIANRLSDNAPRYNLMFREDGTTVLVWYLIGLFICGIGQYFAMHIIMKNTNALCDAYNRRNGLY